MAGAGGATVGLGVGGVMDGDGDGVDDGVGGVVGEGDGETDGEGRFAVEAPGPVAFGLAAGAAHAATRARIRSATAGRWRDMSCPPEGDSSTLTINVRLADDICHRS